MPIRHVEGPASHIQHARGIATHVRVVDPSKVAYVEPDYAHAVEAENNFEQKSGMFLKEFKSSEQKIRGRIHHSEQHSSEYEQKGKATHVIEVDPSKLNYHDPHPRHSVEAVAMAMKPHMLHNFMSPEAPTRGKVSATSPTSRTQRKSRKGSFLRDNHNVVLHPQPPPVDKSVTFENGTSKMNEAFAQNPSPKISRRKCSVLVPVQEPGLHPHPPAVTPAPPAPSFFDKLSEPLKNKGRATHVKVQKSFEIPPLEGSREEQIRIFEHGNGGGIFQSMTKPPDARPQKRVTGMESAAPQVKSPPRRQGGSIVGFTNMTKANGDPVTGRVHPPSGHEVVPPYVETSQYQMNPHRAHITLITKQ
eukprot:PhF_6_TR13610/c0_g1_i1/m.21782